MRHSFMGVDPGIVHTGVVTFEFWPDVRKWCINHAVIKGLDEHEVEKIRNTWNIQRVFIEAYNPRSHFNTDARMVEAISRFRKEIKHAKVIKNTGAKQVVKTPFMQMLDVWTFNTVTHHQDLRAAARIGLYGALKDEELNSVLTQFLTDTLAGAFWAPIYQLGGTP